MCGRRSETTTLPNPRADFLSDRPTQSGGPIDESFG